MNKKDVEKLKIGGVYKSIDEIDTCWLFDEKNKSFKPNDVKPFSKNPKMILLKIISWTTTTTFVCKFYLPEEKIISYYSIRFLDLVEQTE